MHHSELKDESRWLKKMYAEERLKSELHQEALEKKWYGVVPI
jgi:putative transposase